MRSNLGITGALVAVTLAGLVLRGASGPGERSPSTPETCTALLDAWEGLELVPAYLAWESFFESVQRTDSTVLRQAGVDGAAREMTTGYAQEALSKSRASRSMTKSSVMLDPSRRPDRIAADAIATARDDLLRALPELTFERLREAADMQARHSSFEIPAPGQLVDVNGVSKCRVTVKGSEFPHLVPEFDYWEFYFKSLAMTAEPFRIGLDDYTAEYIRAVQRKSLQIDIAQIRRLLTVAKETKEMLDGMRQRGADNASMASVVLAARAQLVRSLPGPAWLVVNREASRTRDGVTFVFHAHPQLR